MGRHAIIEELRSVVEEMHGCSPVWVESTPVDHEIVRDGIVDTFALTGHEAASKCYAWFSPPQDGASRQTFAILERPPVASAAEAVGSAADQMRRIRAMMGRT